MTRHDFTDQAGATIGRIAQASESYSQTRLTIPVNKLSGRSCSVLMSGSLTLC